MATLQWSCKNLHSPNFSAPFVKPPPRGSRLSSLRAASKDSSSSSAAPSPSSLDVSVFRFTLGIPGFDDSNLPRVLGTAFGAVLLLNHFLTADSVTAAQWGARPTNVATSMSRIRQVFVLSKTLLLEEKEDLAWGSYALLKNTKTTSLVIWNKGLVCARGLWEVPQDSQRDVLEWLEETVKKSSLFTYSSLIYEPFKADKRGWGLIPKGVVCSLFLPFKGSAVRESNMDLMLNKAFILLLSSIPNAFSQKDILWVERLSNKILASRMESFEAV